MGKDGRWLFYVQRLRKFEGGMYECRPEAWRKRAQQVQKLQGGVTFPTWKGLCLQNGGLCTDFFHSTPIVSHQMTR